MGTLINGIRTIGIPVTDQDRALAFYTEDLGFDTQSDSQVPQLGGRWITVVFPGDAISLALEPARNDRPTGVQTGLRLGTADADALHAALEEQGVAVGEMLRWPDVPPMFTITDPDGNVLSVTEDSGR